MSDINMPKDYTVEFDYKPEKNINKHRSLFRLTVTDMNYNHKGDRVFAVFTQVNSPNLLIRASTTAKHNAGFTLGDGIF